MMHGLVYAQESSLFAASAFSRSRLSQMHSDPMLDREITGMASYTKYPNAPNLRKRLPNAQCHQQIF